MQERRRDGDGSGTGVHTGPPAFETGDEPPTPRRVAPGGWQRAFVGLALGAAAGALVALVAPRDEGPRRRVDLADRPRPYEA